MDSAQSEEVKVEGNNTGGFYERFVALPVVSEAISQTTAVYNAVKHTHPLAEYACDTGESVVKRVTETAYNVGTPIAGIALKAAKPLVGDDPVSSLDQVATKTLAKCEEKFPIITKHPSEIIVSTVDTLKDKADSYYNTVNNTRIVQFTHARINEAIALSELAVEVILPADPNCDMDVEEEAQASSDIKENLDAMEAPGNTQRVFALGKRIKRRGTKKLMTLAPVQFSYDSNAPNHVFRGPDFQESIPPDPPSGTGTFGQMVSIQENMTSLINRSHEASKTVHEACLVIPNLAIKLTGEAVVNTKAFVIAFTNTYSLKDIPGSVASVSGKVVKPVKDATGRIVAQLLLPPKMVAEYILSSKPIQCLIPNIVVFEEISKIEIEMDELADDSENDVDEDDEDDGDIKDDEEDIETKN